MFTYLFAIAIGMGTAIIVGRLVGGNEKDEAYTRVWKSVQMGDWCNFIYGHSRCYIPQTINGTIYG